MQDALVTLGVRAAVLAMTQGRSAALTMLKESASELFENYVASHPLHAARLVAFSFKKVANVTVKDLKSLPGEFLVHQDEATLTTLLNLCQRESFAGETVREFVSSGRLFAILTAAKELGPDFETVSVSLSHLEGNQ